MTQKGKLCDWLCVDIDSGHWKLTQWRAVNFPSTQANTAENKWWKHFQTIPLRKETIKHYENTARIKLLLDNCA